jgi:hypothetical protein
MFASIPEGFQQKAFHTNIAGSKRSSLFCFTVSDGRKGFITLTTGSNVKKPFMVVIY